MARVLIVDDEQRIRTSLGEFIKQEGHTVSLAADASEALSLLREELFDVVVTDIILPRKSGVALLGNIHDTQPDVQIIMITDEPEIETAMEAVRKGAFDYLTKPISRDDITRTVSAAAEKKALLDKNRHLEEENQEHCKHLEELVAEQMRQLRDSEGRLGLFFEKAPDAYYLSSLKGTFIDGNEAAEKLCGYAREELIGKSFLNVKLLSPRQIAKASMLLARNALGKETGPNELILTRKDGKQVPIEIRTNPVKIQGKTLVLALARDITERKRVEESLARSQELVKQAGQMAKVGGWEVDAKTLEVTWTEETYRIHELPLDQHPPLDKAVDFFDPEDRTKLRHAIQRALNHGEPYDLELRLTTAKGKRLWTHSICTPKVVDGKTVKLVGIFQDITERKQAEEQLKEYSERLEEMVEERTKELREAQEQLVRREKLAVLGQLAGGVGHDLRNALGAIKNAAYFLNMVLEKPDPEVKETLEILGKEVGTSEAIISSLLDFAQAKPPTKRKISVSEVLQEALSRITVPENVEVVQELDETLPEILADPDQLAQVFGNVILNGIQAMTEGGQLTIKSEALAPGRMSVSITDTGVGIPEEQLEKLFEPLYTTKAKGIGLGLAIVKTLVEGHGGTIEVEGEPGKGSTFTVKLPTSMEEES